MVFSIYAIACASTAGFIPGSRRGVVLTTSSSQQPQRRFPLYLAYVFLDCCSGFDIWSGDTRVVTNFAESRFSARCMWKESRSIRRHIDTIEDSRTRIQKSRGKKGRAVHRDVTVFFTCALFSSARSYGALSVSAFRSRRQLRSAQMSSAYEDDYTYECSVSYTYDPNNNKNVLEEEDIDNDDNRYSLRNLRISGSSNATTKNKVILKDLKSITTIGTGTFGRVELTKHRRTGQHFALKILNIHKVIKTRQVEHVHNEKKVLNQLEHPFIVKLISTDMDDTNLYMIMEFIPGGELFSYLRASRVFSNAMSRFYAAEIVCALEYIHGKNIVYRDLKPENLMLCRDGHIKMADFGFAKELRDRTYTLCGTPEYLAPESLANKGHNKAVDWWALGILIYEMMAGRPPFRGNNTSEIYDSIMEHKLKFPRSFNLVAKDIVKKLLEIDRTLRLGCMKNGVRDVLDHKWFQKIDWEDLRQLKVEPPIIPTLYHPGDTGNFDIYEEEKEQGPIAELAEKEMFSEW
ncbi:hypothetical protein Y032_0173g420 [Ancylostoma ceylanicum]|uniref:cAMP-dependent protein kinase, catalytic subunit-like n=2 Tax=Ancylostoma TaxID=29169 RepID=A0A016SUB5_9BILA|nr:hypothetical protein Y032_0173g420 [Ancylostoma ceylanicum]